MADGVGVLIPAISAIYSVWVKGYGRQRLGNDQNGKPLGSKHSDCDQPAAGVHDFGIGDIFGGSRG
uniref:Uncharacterized protein n=2 Tax=Oryza TaxID=4527 RepID=A0A0D3HDI3_9ORYZ